MKRLNSLSKEELKELFFKSKELKKVTKEEVYNQFDFIIMDYLEIFKPILNEYSIGLYNSNYITFKNNISHEDIKRTIDDCIYNFSASDEILEEVEKGNYSLDLLKKLVEEKILSEVEYYEEILYNDNELFNFFIENTIDFLDNYYITNNDKLIKVVEVV